MRTLVNLFCCALVASCCFSAWAHDGGERRLPKPKNLNANQIRHAPHQPEVLEQDQLERLIAEEKISQDVAAIRCSLYEFANCRGVGIVLHDPSGKQIAKANTGTNGIVGFEGLKPNTKYIARIESEKYQGEAQVWTGGIYAINGERK